MTIEAELELTDTLNPHLHAQLGRELIAYNEALLGGSCVKPLTVLIRHKDGHLIGGLSGRTSFGWLFIELLFVPEALRGTGIGTRILEMAEEEGRIRGCSGVWLDTLNPAACRFYQKRGYLPFGELPMYPADNARVFLSKRL
jgi:GNAT superfamily N-acetyltransferase